MSMGMLTEISLQQAQNKNLNSKVALCVHNSSCKLLILFVRKLTKAYKVNRIAINYCQISLELACISILKGKGPVISLIRIFH